MQGLIKNLILLIISNDISFEISNYLRSSMKKMTQIILEYFARPRWPPMHDMFSVSFAELALDIEAFVGNASFRIEF